jgi:hypothetical protein
MSGTVTAEFVSTREIESLDDALRLLAESRRSILLETIIEGKPSRGILVDYEVYRELLQRLEDLEDLRAMHEAVTEYRAPAPGLSGNCPLFPSLTENRS